MENHCQSPSVSLWLPVLLCYDTFMELHLCLREKSFQLSKQAYLLPWDPRP